MAEPPYQRIATALRHRIESGELAPGDLVPSTRELAREWDVALATAAHALQALAREGLVRGVPRVGTVVATATAGPQRNPEPELSRGRIVAAAMQIADREGIGALTLRGVAAKLDAPVMSLYRHVGSKAELVRAMADAALGEESLPSARPPGWRAQVELAARAQWRVLRRHPWLARVMSLTRPNPLPHAMAHAEWLLRALEGHGLDAAERMRLHVLIYGFVQGIAVNLETEAEVAGETGVTDEQWMESQLGAFTALARSGRYPAFAEVLRELDSGFDLDFDALFEQGLAALLDGFAGRLERRGR
jgi:DNA-binding transcriptional regulator YhcF (GntR family)